MAREMIRDGVASERVASAMRAGILSGVYQPGARIRQESVALEFGASRLPVREALRMLEAEGLVTLVPNTGAWVSRLSLEECDELYQIRERIEPLLLRYSMPLLDAAAIDRLQELAQRMEAGHDVQEFLRLDRDFHLSMYAGARTSYLSETVLRLWNSTQHYRRAFTRLLDGDGNRILHDEHHMLIAAVRDHDADEAERVLLGHIRRTRLQLGRHPEVFT